MRFRLLPLLAAFLAMSGAGKAWAQTAPASPGLRGGLPGDSDPFVLAPQAEDQTGSIAADDTAEPDTGRVSRQTRVLGGPETDPLAENVAAGPVRKTKQPEDDPFAALGIRKGTFIWYPSLTATAGYSTNASGSPGGGASPTLTLTPEMFVTSDWARHEATLTLRGSYEKFLDGSQPDDPSGSVEVTGRIDLKRGWNINLDGRYEYSTQAISDPNFPAGVDTPPGVHDLFGSAALNGEFGRGVFTAAVNGARTAYENGTSGGLVVDQGDRTNNVFGARLRLGYETPLDVTPFVEGEVAKRVYDRALDNNGLRRSSFATIVRAGFEFNRDPVLTGDFSVGYGAQTFDDPALATLRALTVDGSLAWSPTRLVTVKLDASTTFSPSTDPASSGSVVHDAALDLAYAVRRDFTLDWTADFRHEEFQGTGVVENNLKAGLAATWKLSRRVWLTGGYVHEWMDSTSPGGSFQSDAVRLELRVQK